MKIRQVPVGRVIPYDRNPRKNSDAIAKVAASIAEFGFRQPIVVDSDMVVIAGHTRLLAAVEVLALKTVPVHVADGLTPEQVAAYRLADNRTGQEAEWDLDLLRQEIRDLDGKIDLAVTGFDTDELGAFLELDGESIGLTGDNDSPPVPETPVSRRGDIWVLGGHRVMCGDSTSAEDLAALMDDGLADACWTDPPYNVDYRAADGKAIQNDKLSDSRFRKMLDGAFAAGFSVMNAGASIYVAHADTEGYNFRGAFLGAGFKLSGCQIWVKESLVLGRSDYQWRHEPILYGWKPGAAHRWFGGRKKTTVYEAIEDLPIRVVGDSVQIDIGQSTLVVTGKELMVEEVLPSIVRMEKPKRSDDHPTMKPVELIAYHLRNSTTVGDVVLDLFGGSGSTLIACQKLSRFARLMELDGRYCDVIVQRWQDFTGSDAVLAGGDLSFDAIAGERAVA